MKSLTGYGKCILEENGRKITIELKSVNHRFLDLSFRMPRVFNVAEDKMRKCISSKCERGHIDIFVTYEDNREGGSVKINHSIAEMMVNASKELSQCYGIDNSYNVSDLLRTPDVVSISVNEEDDNQIIDITLKALNVALDNLCNMRSAEGKSMYDDIVKRIAIVESDLEKIIEQAPKVSKDYSEKLTKRIKEALVDINVDEARLLNEIAIFQDRCNIDEEIARLTSHIKEFKKHIHSPIAIGRKIDFLLQEMNRETNTIGSKAQDYLLSSIVVDIKYELEKIREQIQNIE